MPCALQPNRGRCSRGAYTSVMAPLPLTKLVGLVIKAVTKPVAKRFKTEAANNDRFRGCVHFVRATQTLPRHGWLAGCPAVMWSPLAICTAHC